LNNHIGVPLTLLSIKKEDEIAVIEMGANHTGEIAELCQIAQPDYGLITNIGKAHLEGFGTIENIIETKTALYRAAQTMFVNRDDEVLRCAVCGVRCELCGEEESWGDIYGRPNEQQEIPRYARNDEEAPEGRSSLYKKSQILFYGKNTDISGTILEMNPCLVIELFGKKIQTQLTGNYNLSNILAAAAIGHHFNIPTDAICNAIAEYMPQNHRSQIINNKDNTIIADYYNANPTSMKAALENFLQIEASHKWAILGDMLELGKKSAVEHQEIIEFCKSNHIKTCFIGSEFYTLRNESAHFFKNVEDFNNHQTSPVNFEEMDGEAVRDSLLILIKGSRGIHLENLRV
jgi:UDP-N-acetylmuramoyl-tripeptide--D-alanyl-D-alanine ligase